MKFRFLKFRLSSLYSRIDWKSELFRKSSQAASDSEASRPDSGLVATSYS